MPKEHYKRAAEWLIQIHVINVSSGSSKTATVLVSVYRLQCPKCNLGTLLFGAHWLSFETGGEQAPQKEVATVTDTHFLKYALHFSTNEN